MVQSVWKKHAVELDRELRGLVSEARSGERWTQRLHCRYKTVNFWVWRVGERKRTDRMNRR